MHKLREVAQDYATLLFAAKMAVSAAAAAVFALIDISFFISHLQTTSSVVTTLAQDSHGIKRKIQGDQGDQNHNS